jgi:NTP pyrophosphatase (non-canonical NTP hydrolase)
MTQSIRDLQRAVHQTACEHGWWDDFGPGAAHRLAKLALVHSEVSEAVEEVRDGTLYLRYPPDGSGKPEGMVVELADAVIRIMDLCEAWGLDLQEAIEIKHAYNQTRPYRHGGKKA